jgi:CHAT domain-containing protein
LKPDSIFKRIAYIFSISVYFILIPIKSFSDCNNDYLIGKECLKIPDYLKASSIFHAALIKSRSEKNYFVEANCLLELGKISSLLSKNDSAIYYLKTGYSIVKNQKKYNTGLLAAFTLEIGKAAEELGNIEEAGEFYKKAISEMESTYGNKNINTALAYSEYAGYFTFKRMYQPELYWSTKAFEILKSSKEKNASILCSILIQHATATKEFYCLKPDSFQLYFPLIRDYYKRSLNIARTYYKKPSYEEGKSLQGLANTYTDCIRSFYSSRNPQSDLNWKTADNLYKQAIRTKEEALGKYNSSVATSKYTHALIYWYHPDLNKNIIALSKFNEAFSVLDSNFHAKNELDCPKTAETFDKYFLSVLLSSKSILLGEIYTATKDKKYLYAKYDHDKVRLKLWDYILASFSKKDIGFVISLWNNAPFEETIQTAYDLYQITGNTKFEKDIFEFAKKGKNNDYTQMLIQSGKLLNGSKTVHSNTISLEELQLKLDEGCMYIEYVQAPTTDIRDSYGIVVTKSQYKVIKLEKKKITDSLQTKLFDAMREGNVKEYNHLASNLYTLLIKPLLNSVDGKINSIVICTSGSYSKIPFEALTISNKFSSSNDFRKLDYLLNHYTINYALNAAMSYSSISKRKNSCKEIAVFAPEFDSLPKLLFSRKQAERLKENFKGDYFFDNSASVNTFIEKASGHSILQVSTHSFSSANPSEMDGALLFSNGKLSLNDLYGKNIQTDLCIVSACQTGDGREEYAEGTKSFARAFAYCGAGSTISTLWCVDDKATALLLENIYYNLEKGTKASTSLVNAKRKYISTCSSSEMANPFYWAGLVYTGNPDVITSLIKTDYYILSALILTIVLLTILVLLRKKHSTVSGS